MQNKVNKDFWFRIESLSVEVTGSCNFVTYCVPGFQGNFVVDCGMFIGKEEQKYNYDLSFDPKQVSHVFITHSHSDHCGRIGCLYNKGYQGKVYASEYTSEKLKTDAMRDFFSMRRTSEKLLYEEEDAKSIINQTEKLELYKTYQISQYLEVILLENAHQKGAVMYLFTLKYNGRRIQVLFTGDYKFKSFFGKSYFPIETYDDPITIVTEATHGTRKVPERKFKKIVKKAIRDGKKLLIVALGDARYEEPVYRIKEMKEDGKIPFSVPVFLELKRNFDISKMNLEILPANVTFCQKTIEREYALYYQAQSILVCTNRGSLTYYLEKVIDKSQYVIIFTMHVTANSLTDTYINTLKGNKVRVGKKELIKKASLFQTDEFSGHDYEAWIVKLLKRFTNIQGILLEHGAFESKQDLQKGLTSKLRTNVYTLERGQAFKITEKGVRYSK